MRILAIDFGEKRVGLALSDPLGITAQGLPTLMNENPQTLLVRIAAICAEQEVGRVVVGLPLKLSGETGPKALEVLRWVEELKKNLTCDVFTWDERLTSREATRLMIAQNLSRKKQKERSDALAAILILQNYLDHQKSIS